MAAWGERLVTWERVALPGADVGYLRALDLGASPAALMQALIEETPWRQEDVTLWGKRYRQPRLVAWYGDPGCAYRYSGVVLAPLAWTERLSDVRARVEAAVETRFNSVLLNYYRNEQDSMGMHSDDETELGPCPVIASVSLGAERRLLFKSKADREAAVVRVPLASGSLLLMRGDTQALYKHGIGKQARALGARVNLTFRVIVR